MEDEGNLFIGLALTLFLPCFIGFIVSFFVLGQPKTKQGAIYGLVAQILLGVCFGGLGGVLSVMGNM